jgi:hypothetical protein
MATVLVSLNSARDFLAYFLESERFRVKTLAEATREGLAGYLFRGQSNAMWPLLPSAHRTTSRLRDFAPMALGDKEQDRWSVADYVLAEAQAMYRFLETADELGLPTPLDFGTLAQKQRLMQDTVEFAWDAADAEDPKTITECQRGSWIGQRTRWLRATSPPRGYRR